MSEIVTVKIGESYKTIPVSSSQDILQTFVARSSRLYYFAFKPKVIKNNDNIYFELYNSDEDLLHQEIVGVNQLIDDYYIVSFSENLLLSIGNVYFIRIYSDISNAVALWYGYRTIPYLETLFVGGARKIGVLDCKFGFSADGYIFDVEDYSIDNDIPTNKIKTNTSIRKGSEFAFLYRGNYNYNENSYGYNNIETVEGLVSVVVNATSNPLPTIDSILFQTYKQVEIVIVDNNLDEQTYFALNNKCLKLRRDGIDIKIVSMPEFVNDAKAFNAGGSFTIGEYILFITGKTSLYCNYIELTMAENVDCCYTDFIYGYEKFKSFEISEMNYRKVACSTATALIRREIFEGFDITLNNYYDWLFFVQIFDKEHTFKYISLVLYVVTERFGMLIICDEKID